MKFFPQNKEKIPGAAKAAVSPNRMFVLSAKERFLAAFDIAYHAHPSSRFVLAYKIGVVIVAVFALTAGASVYADTKNVAADSAFYPFKRLSETLELTLSSPQARPALEAALAARRAAEIDDLGLRSPSSTILAGLKSDLRADIGSSAEGAERAGLQDGQLSTVCNRLESVIQAHPSAVSVALMRHPRVAAFLENKCGQSEGSSSEDVSSTGDMDNGQ